MVITDKLASDGAARREVLPSVEHRRHQGLNNRAEHAHQPTRERERRMRRFTSPGHAQRFLAAYGPSASHVRPRRHRLTAAAYREYRARAHALGGAVTGVAAAACSAGWPRSSTPSGALSPLPLGHVDNARSTGKCRNSERRYSPAACTGADRRRINGNPGPRHVSTSRAERQALTMRIQMRCFPRLADAFSKKVDNLEHAVVPHFRHDNRCRAHQISPRRDLAHATLALATGVAEVPLGRAVMW